MHKINCSSASFVNNKLQNQSKLGIQISKRHFQYLNQKQNIILRKELVVPPERWYRHFLDLMSKSYC
jgi:hypothetical protein